MVMTMLRLNYNSPRNLYYSYINYHIQKQTGREYFLMIQYCRVDFSKGSELLASYYANNLLSEKSSEYNNYHHIGYLITWFIDNLNVFLPEIIKLTNLKNEIAGKCLKQAILSFLNGITDSFGGGSAV